MTADSSILEQELLFKRLEKARTLKNYLATVEINDCCRDDSGMYCSCDGAPGGGGGSVTIRQGDEFDFEPMKTMKGGPLAGNSVIIIEKPDENLLYAYDKKEDALDKIKWAMKNDYTVKLGNKMQLDVDTVYLLPKDMPKDTPRERQYTLLQEQPAAVLQKIDSAGNVVDRTYFTKSLKPIPYSRFMQTKKEFNDCHDGIGKFCTDDTGMMDHSTQGKAVKVVSKMTTPAPKKGFDDVKFHPMRNFSGVVLSPASADRQASILASSIRVNGIDSADVAPITRPRADFMGVDRDSAGLVVTKGGGIALAAIIGDPDGRARIVPLDTDMQDYNIVKRAALKMFARQESVNEFNDCHLPSGDGGGQFCSADDVGGIGDQLSSAVLSDQVFGFQDAPKPTTDTGLSFTSLKSKVDALSDFGKDARYDATMAVSAMSTNWRTMEIPSEELAKFGGSKEEYVRNAIQGPQKYSAFTTADRVEQQRMFDVLIQANPNTPAVKQWLQAEEVAKSYSSELASIYSKTDTLFRGTSIVELNSYAKDGVIGGDKNGYNYVAMTVDPKATAMFSGGVVIAYDAESVRRNGGAQSVEYTAKPILSGQSANVSTSEEIGKPMMITYADEKEVRVKELVPVNTDDGVRVKAIFVDKYSYDIVNKDLKKYEQIAPIHLVENIYTAMKNFGGSNA